jgi:hypothetical protein
MWRRPISTSIVRADHTHRSDAFRGRLEARRDVL